MKTATKPQIQKIYILLKNLGIVDQKADIINSYSAGRTTSTRQLSTDEARSLIARLSEYDPKERLKSLIFSLAYQCGIIYGSSAEDKKINPAKLNLFLKERGSVKKDLNEMEYQELIKTHRQFEAIAKNVQKSQDNKQADQAVKQLLEELNIN